MNLLPSVSIIIPVKNPGHIVKRVLSAIFLQDYKGETEVVIVDSGSTDGTLEYFNELNKAHKNIQVICISPEEFGHGKTRNLAISKSKGELIAVITHDATPVNSKWLENMVEPFLVNQNVAGVFGRHCAYEDADIFTKRELDQHFNSFNKTPPITFYKIENQLEYSSNKNLQMFYCFFSDNNAMLRKSVWERIPYEDVNFAEDQKWAKSILEAGYIKAYADKAVVYHSHTYTTTEVFSRSFEEAVSFQLHFQHQVLGRILEMIKVVLSSIKINYIIILRTNDINLLRKIYYILSRPFYISAKFFGYYLGSKKRVSKFLYNTISIDHKLMKTGIGRVNKK